MSTSAPQPVTLSDAESKGLQYPSAELPGLVTTLGGEATFSECGSYRYELWRRWSDRGGVCMFVGLNPSTADATRDDPTIRKCVKFAKRWGHGALCMVNLFAFRATDPVVMKLAKDPVGPENDRYLKHLAFAADIVVAAWGNDGRHMRRDAVVRLLIPKLHCLQQNNDKSPAHPLYLRDDATPYLLP